MKVVLICLCIFAASQAVPVENPEFYHFSYNQYYHMSNSTDKELLIHMYGQLHFKQEPEHHRVQVVAENFDLDINKPVTNDTFDPDPAEYFYVVYNKNGEATDLIADENDDNFPNELKSFLAVSFQIRHDVLSSHDNSQSYEVDVKEHFGSGVCNAHYSVNPTENGGLVVRKEVLNANCLFPESEKRKDDSSSSSEEIEFPYNTSTVYTFKRPSFAIDSLLSIETNQSFWNVNSTSPETDAVLSQKLEFVGVGTFNESWNFSNVTHTKRIEGNVGDIWFTFVNVLYFAGALVAGFLNAMVEALNETLQALEGVKSTGRPILLPGAA